jgi:mannose/fructose/N-acetylgalactosamine-specific phosphotransferase system component IIB
MAGSNFVVRGGADFSAIDRGLKNTQNNLKKFKGDTERTSHGINETLSGMADGLGLSFANLGKAAAIAAATKALVDFGKHAVGVASDLKETQNVVDVTFGSMSQDINNFAGTALDKLGLSELSAKKFTSTMGAMLKSSGISGNTMKEMSKNLTTLSADMASFYNLGDEAAFQKIMSGMSGMTMPLKELGINMNVANLEAYAMSQGISKSWQEMTQAEQTLLRYNYLMSVTGDAQGDFARNTGTWANQTKLLKEQWQQFMGIIGNGLIQVLLPFVKLLNKILSGLIKIAHTVGKVFAMITGKQVVDNSTVQAQQEAIDTGIDLSDVNVGIGKAADKAGKAQTGLGKGIDKARKAVQKALAPFDEINRLQNNMGDTGGSGIGGGGGGFNPGINTGGLGTIDVGPSISDGLDQAKKKAKDFFPWFTERWNDFRGLVGEPVTVPAPAFAELPDPVWHPNWGLDLPTIPIPSFPELPVPVFHPQWGLVPPLVPIPVFPQLPVPVFNPVWNLVPPPIPAVNLGLYVASLLNMEGLTSTSLANVQENVRSALGAVEGSLAANKVNVGNIASQTSKAFAQNWAQGLATTDRNVRIFAPGVQSNLQLLGMAVAAVGAETARSYAANLASGFSIGIKNAYTFAQSANGAMRSAGRGILSTTAEIGKGIVTNIGNALSTAWQSFRDFARATGEKIGGWFSANKGVIVKTTVVAGAVVGGAAAIHFLGPAAVPYIAKGMAALKAASLAGAFAGGGFPPEGQLFVANEAGPELIGSIGGKTAVANNSQIVEAVSQGVYEAVSSAQGSKDINLTIKIGDETLTRKVIKNINRQSRIDGATIITV